MDSFSLLRTLNSQRKKTQTVCECVICNWVQHRNVRWIPKYVTVSPIWILVSIESMMIKKNQPRQKRNRAHTLECDTVGLGRVERYRIMFFSMCFFFLSIKWYLYSLILNIATDFMVPYTYLSTHHLYIYTHTNACTHATDFSSIFFFAPCQYAPIHFLILYRLICV